jgi:hypothetical protein
LVVSVAAENSWFLGATRFSTLRSVSLCGLPPRGWAVVAPRRFHFRITALTVDRDSFSKAEFWRTDLLERRHPMTVPRWKSFSMGYSTANVWLWRLHGCVLDFIHQSAMGVAEIAESTNWTWCAHTFQCVS